MRETNAHKLVNGYCCHPNVGRRLSKRWILLLRECESQRDTAGRSAADGLADRQDKVKQYAMQLFEI